MFAGGLTAGYGLMYVEIQREFNSSAALTAWIGATQFAIMLAFSKYTKKHQMSSYGRTDWAVTRILHITSFSKQVCIKYTFGFQHDFLSKFVYVYIRCMWLLSMHASWTHYYLFWFWYTRQPNDVVFFVHKNNIWYTVPSISWYIKPLYNFKCDILCNNHCPESNTRDVIYTKLMGFIHDVLCWTF